MQASGNYKVKGWEWAEYVPEQDPQKIFVETQLSKMVAQSPSQIGRLSVCEVKNYGYGRRKICYLTLDLSQHAPYQSQSKDNNNHQFATDFIEHYSKQFLPTLERSLKNLVVTAEGAYVCRIRVLNLSGNPISGQCLCFKDSERYFKHIKTVDFTSTELSERGIGALLVKYPKMTIVVGKKTFDDKRPIDAMMASRKVVFAWNMTEKMLMQKTVTTLLQDWGKQLFGSLSLEEVVHETHGLQVRLKLDYSLKDHLISVQNWEQIVQRNLILLVFQMQQSQIYMQKFYDYKNAARTCRFVLSDLNCSGVPMKANFLWEPCPSLTTDEEQCLQLIRLNLRKADFTNTEISSEEAMKLSDPQHFPAFETQGLKFNVKLTDFISAWEDQEQKARNARGKTRVDTAIN